MFCYTNKQTNCMEQSPSQEADIHSASQEIARLLWILNVHYRVHKSLSLVPILSQMSPCYVGPCQHSLAPPRIAERSRLLDMEGGCKCIE
jgi:hypothetical protein